MAVRATLCHPTEYFTRALPRRLQRTQLEETLILVALSSPLRNLRTHRQRLVDTVQRQSTPSAQVKYSAISSSDASKRSPRTTLLLSSLTSAYFPRLSSLIERDRDLWIE